MGFLQHAVLYVKFSFSHDKDTILKISSFCSTFTQHQLKTLQTSWCTIPLSWLRKSTVPLNVKVVVLRMCFCVLTRVKLYLNDEFEDVLKSLCEAVNMGIKNVILSRPYDYDMKRDDLLGLGINVTEELKVCSVVYFYRPHAKL